MAKMKKDAEAEAAEGETPKPKSKKKLIIMVTVIVLIGAFVAKTILLKPKPLTAAQVALAAKLADLKLENTCASHNGLATKPLPTDGKRQGQGGADHDHHHDRRRAHAGRARGFARLDHDQPRGRPLPEGRAWRCRSRPAWCRTTVKNTENWEAVALKTVIDTLSGETIDTLSAQRQADENSIGDAVCRKTDGKVLTIYFTDFVMQ